VRTGTKIILGASGLVALLLVAAVALCVYHVISFSLGQRHLATGHAKMHQEQYEAAIDDYTRALQCSIGKTLRSYALANRGVCRARSTKGLKDEAVDDLTAALRLDDRLGYVYLERGTIRTSQGDEAAAWDDYSRAVAVDPNASTALFYRGMISARRKQWSAAIVDFSEAIRANPNAAEIYVHRALAYDQMNDVGGAHASFDAAIQISAKNVIAYLERGKFFARRHDLTRAIEDFSRALAIAADASNVRHARAHAFAANGQWPEAIADWSEILRLNSRDEHALEKRGRAYSWTGEADRALVDLSELIRITQSGRAYELRGQAFVRAGRYQEAIADYTVASRQGGKSGIPVKTLAWLLATCPEPSVRRGEEAVKEATEACLKNNWSDWNRVDTLAAAYAEVGDFEQAAKYQEQALATPNLHEEQRKELEDRLALYRAGIPYRDLPKPP